MGIYIDQGNTVFYLKKEYQVAALASLQDLHQREDYLAAERDDVLEAANLEEALLAWGWGVEYDEAGDICGLELYRMPRR